MLTQEDKCLNWNSRLAEEVEVGLHRKSCLRCDVKIPSLPSHQDSINMRKTANKLIWEQIWLNLQDRQFDIWEKKTEFNGKKNEVSVFILFGVMHQSIPAAPIPPPPGNCGAFARIVSPGGRALAYPRATPGLFDTRGFWLEIQTKTILSKKTNSLSLIGLSVKDWTKLWRFLKVYFLDFRHFLIVYQATTLKRDRERSSWLCISRSKRIPGVGHLLSSFIPTPGNLPPKTKKVLMPGG